MDVLDKKIICILERNCRTPISTISKQLRTNRNVITYRLKKLKNNGIVRKYITTINLGKLSYSTYKIYFKVNQFEKTEIFIQFLKRTKEVIHLIKLEGEYNLSCVVVARNIVELDNFLTKIKTKYEKVIKELQVSIVVYSKIFKFEKLLLEEKDQPIKIEKYSSNEEVIKLDDVDKRILHVLSQEANLSYIELMKRTDFSLDIIKYRMKKLKANIISSFRILFDLSKFGYFHYVILIKTNNMNINDEEKLKTWSTMKRNVMYCTKRIGNYDFEINIAIRDINDLRSFINELQKEFSNNIDEYSTILISNVLKLNYVPF
jgi:Lrp/AsnC family transcriptional regulator for asnA, asnC and gidA